MKGVYVIILGIGSFFTSIYSIYQLNTVGEAASLSFAAENYTASVVLYHQLIDSMDYPHSEAKLNLAHSYYRAGDTTVNVQLYNQITIEDTNRTIRSLAHQQLGAIRYDKQNIEKALEKYKQALKADPYNEEARFNYELLKKRQQDPNQQQKDQQKKDKEQKNKDQQDQKDKQQGDQKDQQNQQGDQNDQQGDGKKDKKGEGKKDQQNQQNGQKDQEKGDKGEQKKQQNGDQQKGEKKEGDQGEGDKKDEQKKDRKEGQKPGKKGEKDGEALSPEEQKRQEEAAERAARTERFEKSGMNEKTAEMLLNASRQREKQYLQQLKKRPSKSPDSDKPDW